jgi:hypothetical protein
MKISWAAGRTPGYGIRGAELPQGVCLIPHSCLRDNESHSSYGKWQGETSDNLESHISLLHLFIMLVVRKTSKSV